MKTPRPSLRLFILAGSIAALLGGHSAQAASATWTGTSATGTWAIGTNWSTTPTAPGSISVLNNPDIATFNNLGYQTITLPTAQNIGGITFATLGAVANPFYLLGGTLLTSANAVIQTDSTYLGIADINTPITAQGNLTLTANGLAGSGLLIGGALNTAASLGNVTLTLNGSNSGFNGVFGNLITGVISQGASSTLKLVKSGTGTWFLGAANTYGGGTDLNGGMLVTNNATALGGSGTIAVLGSTTLRTTTALTDASARISISDAATLTFDTFNIAQTWAGVLGNSGIANTAGLTKTGLGTLTITPAAAAVQTYKGATTVNMGTLTISGASQAAGFTNLIDSASALVLGGGNLNFTGKVGFINSQTFFGTTLNAGISGFIPANNTGTNTVDFKAITRNSGSLLNLTTDAGYTLKATGTSNDAGVVVKGVFIAGNDFATVNSGTGVISAATYATANNAANTWTGSTTNVQTNAALTNSSVGTVTLNGLKLNGAGSQSFTIGGTLTVNDGIIFGSSIAGNASQISGGSLTGPSGSTGTGDLIIVNNNAQTTYGRNTVSSTIVDNGSATNLILYGAANGNLYISGANTYTGNTYVGAGQNTAAGAVVIGGAGGASGATVASIGSAGKTVFVNGGTGGSSNVLQVGNGDATGDVKGAIQLDNGKLSLKRTDTFTLSATVAGTAGGGFISQDSTGTANVTLASGTNLFQTLGSTAAGTLNLSGAGTYYFNSAATGFNASSTTNFNSGSYYFTGTGNATNTMGNWAINGASVTLATGRYFGNGSGQSLTLNSGTFRVEGNTMNNEGASTVGTGFTYTIAGGNFITTQNTNGGGAWAWGLGTGTTASTGSFIANQTGGEVTVGSPENTNISPGSPSNHLQMGTTNAAHASTYNLSGGVMRSAGGIASAQVATQSGLTLTNASATTGVSGNNTQSLVVGYGVSGTGIAANTTVSAITSNATASTGTINTNTVTVASATGLAIGQYVGGNAAIPLGTTITAISGTTVTLSNNITTALSAVSLTYNLITLNNAFTGTTTTAGSGFYGSTSTTNVASFNWTGGRLTAPSMNMTGIGSNNSVTNTVSNVYQNVVGTLNQGGSTSIMAPGETFNGQLFTGRTAITGGYRIDAGSVAIGIGGTTAATAYHNTSTGTFDNIAITTGTLTLNSTNSLLNVSLNSFTPNPADSFSIITGATSITGNFANVDSAGRINLIGGGNMAESTASNTVTLSNYAGGSSVIWKGNLSTTWDIATASNFTKNTTGTAATSTYTDGDYVTFNDIGTPSYTVNLTSAVSPGSVTVNTANTYTIGGSGGISGTGGLTLTTGTLNLNTANSYTGATTVTAGTLQLGNATALGTTALGTTVATGAVLDLNGQTVGAEALTLSGTGISSGGALINSSGTAASLSGLVTLGIASSIGGSGNTTLSGGIAGLVDLNKVGAGTLTLTGASSTRTTAAATAQINGGVLSIQNNTALGTNATANTIPVTVNSGIIELNGSGLVLDNGLQVTLNNGTTFRSNGSNTSNAGINVANTGTVSTTISTVNSGDIFSLGNGANDITGGSSSSIVRISGPGTVLLSQSSNYTGNWSVDAGTLLLQSSVADLGATSTATLTLNGGNLKAQYTQAGGNRTFVAGAGNNVTVSADSTITSDVTTATTAGITYTFGALGIGANTLTIAGGSNVNSGTAGVTFGTTTLSGNAIFNVTNPTNGGSTLLTLGALADGGTARTITKSGNGALTLGTAATSLVNGTAVNITGGTLNSNLTGALGSLAAVSVSGGATFGAGATQTIGSLAGAGTVAITTGLTLTVGNTNNLSSAFSGGTTATTGVLTKAGSGTLTLSGANLHTGGTNITGGTIRATTVVGALGNGVLTLSGGNLELASDTTGLNFARNTTISSNATITSDTLTSGAGVTHTLGTLGISGQTLTIAKGISATGTTAGVIFGATTFSTANSTFSLGANTTLTLGAVTNSTFTPTITGAGNFAQSGVWGNGAGGINFDSSFSGAATLNQANTFTGGVTLSGGTLNINSAGAAGTNGPLGNGGTFVINGGTIDNTSGSAKTVANVNPLTINADFAFTGGTGTTHDLSLGTGATTLGTASGTSRTITANAGILTLGGAIGNGTTANSIIKAGLGTLTLTGTNTYTGATTINSGILQLGAGGGAGTLSPTSNIVDNANFTINRTGTVTQGTDFGTISTTGTGSFTQAGAGTTIFTAANSYNGTTTISAGTLQIGNATTTGDLGSSSGVALNGGNLTFNRATNLFSYTNAITGASSGTITQAGSGALTLGAVSSVNTITRSVSTGALTLGTITDISTLTDNSTTGNTAPTTITQSGTGLTIGTINGASGSVVNLGGTGTTAIANILNTAGQTVSFNGGTINLNGSGAYGSNLVVNGATVNTVNTTSNSVNFQNVVSLQVLSGTFNSQELNGVRFGNTFGTGSATGPANASVVQSGGTSNYTNGGINLGSSATSAFLDTYAMSGGTINLIGGQGISIGAGASGNTSSFNFSGGKIVESGTISGSQGTGATTNLTTANTSTSATVGSATGLYVGLAVTGTNITAGTTITAITGTTVTLSVAATGTGTNSTVFAGAPNQSFVWTAGTLAAATYDATNLTSTQGTAVSGSTNTLTNAGSGILAPGDIGTGGKTVITGNYNVTSANASYAVDLGSATAATLFQSGLSSYDQTTVSGTTALGGKLNVSLINSFTPANDTTTLFNVLVGSASGITGTFTNQMTATSGNSRVVLADGLTSMLVANNNTASTATTGGLTGVGARTVALGGYQAANTYNAATSGTWDAANAASWTNFDSGSSSGASGAIAQFADGASTGTGANTLTLNTTRNIQGVQFSSTVAGHNYTINNAGSGAITLDNTRNAVAATISDSSASGNSNNINVPITLASNLAVSVTNAALTIGGAIGEASAGKTLTKTGAGTLTFSGANTYTGATTISLGTLQFAKTSSLYNGTTGSWTAANIKVASGGTLALNVGGTNEFTTGNVTTLLTNLGGTNGTSTTGFASGSKLAFDTTNASGSTFTVADTIADSTGVGGGAIGITKLGTNSLVLTGPNAYTGGTTIGNASNEGIVQITNVAGFGTGTVAIRPGTTSGAAQLNFTVPGSGVGSSAANPNVITNVFNLGGQGTGLLAGGFGAIQNVSGFNKITGNITRTNTGGGTYNIVSAANTLELAGTLSSGVTSTRIFDFGGAGDIVVSGVINNGSGTTQVVKDGAGTLTLSNTNAYTGATTINAGTLSINTIKDVSGGNSAVGAPTSAGTGLIVMGNAATTGTLLYTGGVQSTNRTIQIGTNNSVAPANTDTGGATIQNDGSAALTFSAATFNTQTNAATGVGANRTLNLQGSNSGTISGVIQDNLVSGTGTGTATVGLTKQGNGTWTLSGTNTYIGATTITTGTLQLDGSTASGSTVGIGTAGTLTGSGTVNGNATLTGSGIINKSSGVIAGTLAVTGGNWNGAGSVTGLVTSSGGTFTIGSAANLTANGDLAVTGGSIAAGSSTSTITGNVNYTSGTGSTFAGVIAGSSKTLTMNGSGATLTLTGANTFTGTTTVTAGILKLNKTGATNTTILTDGNIATTSDIVINGGTLELADSEQIANTGSINMSSGAFNFGTATGKTETIDKFTNSGGVFTTGANTLIGLGATLTWSGGTNTVSNGGLVQDAHIVISGGTNTVQGGATGGVLELLTGGIGLEMSSGATLTLNSDSAVAGKLKLSGDVSTLDATTVSISNSGALANLGNIDLNGANRNFTIFAGGTMNVSAVITNGALTKLGAGTMTLSGANTYGGSTTVSAGILLAGNTSGSATGSGALVISQGATHGTLGGTGIISASSVTLNGDGTVPNNAVLMIGNTNNLAGTAGKLTLGASGPVNLAGMIQFDIFNRTSTTNTYGAGNNDLLTLSGAGVVNFASTAIVKVNDVFAGGLSTGTGGNTLAAGDSWKLIDWTTLYTGGAGTQLATFSLPTISGFGWDTSSFYTAGTISLTAIPEPSRAVLMLLGAAGLLMRRRRKGM